jgi:hypothetical protein
MAKRRKTKEEVLKAFQACGLDIRFKCLPGLTPVGEEPKTWTLLDGEKILYQGAGSRLMDYLEGVKAVTTGTLEPATAEAEETPAEADESASDSTPGVPYADLAEASRPEEPNFTPSQEW